MECDPTRMCERLVGLGDVEVLGVDDEQNAPLRVHIRRRGPKPDCGDCGALLWSDGERPVELVDLPAFGRTVRLVWHKRRWRCARQGCSAGAVTEQDPTIAPVRERLTARAGRWATRQGGPWPRRLKTSLRSWDAVGTGSTRRCAAGAGRSSTRMPHRSQMSSRWDSTRRSCGAGDGSGPRPGPPASSTSRRASCST